MRSYFVATTIKQEEKDITQIREKVEYSHLTLVAEIARYLNRSCIELEEIIESSVQKMDGVLQTVNSFNEMLYDVVIPKLFNSLYELAPDEKTEEHEIELIKQLPSDKDCYEMRADKDLVVRKTDEESKAVAHKSFHVDNYCFDSWPEKNLFWKLINDKKISKIYFTGMLTHGQSDFFIQYIDPETHTVRHYYPDFLYEEEGGHLVIVEVKGDNMFDDPVVQAKKEYADQIAVESGMSYQMIRASEV